MQQKLRASLYPASAFDPAVRSPCIPGGDGSCLYPELLLFIPYLRRNAVYRKMDRMSICTGCFLDGFLKRFRGACRLCSEVRIDKRASPCTVTGPQSTASAPLHALFRGIHHAFERGPFHHACLFSTDAPSGLHRAVMAVSYCMRLFGV